MNAAQQAFVREYLICRNASEAALKAGYSPKTAGSQGHRLLKNAEVAAAIAKAEEKAEERAEKTLDDVIAELTRVAFSGMSKFITITPEGDPMIDLSGCTPADLDLLAEATIEDFTEGRGDKARDVRRIKIKPLDRMNALVTLGKHLGLGNKTADQAQNSIAAALRDIASRNASAAPLRADMRDDDE